MGVKTEWREPTSRQTLSSDVVVNITPPSNLGPILASLALWPLVEDIRWTFRGVGVKRSQSLTQGPMSAATLSVVSMLRSVWQCWGVRKRC
jgi:hypothetical protein